VASTCGWTFHSSDTVIVVRGGAELCALALSAITTIWVSRAVGPTLFGYYAVSAVLFQLGALILNLGLSSAGAQEVANDEANARRSWIAVTLGRLVPGLILLIAAEAAIHAVSIPPILAATLSLTCPAWLGAAIRSEWLLVALARLASVSLLRLATSLGSLLVAVMFIRSEADAEHFWLLLVTPVLVAAGGSALAAHQATSRLTTARADVLTDVRRLIRTGPHYMMGDLSTFIVTSSDRIFLFAFATPTVVGLYDAAYRLIQPFYSVAAVVNDAFFARIARTLGSPSFAVVFRRYVELSCIFTIPLGFVCAGHAAAIIDLAYGERYAAGADLLAILGWVITFGFTSGVVVTPFTAWNRAREFGRAITGGSVTNLALNFMLIPPLGGFGAAVSTIAAKVAVTIAGYRTFKRATQYPIAIDFARFGAASAAALVGSLLVREELGGLAGLISFLILYLAIMVPRLWSTWRSAGSATVS
jgi:O-antigen/teichoic acid export membrane protein